jgi:hypothetical protein
MQCLRWGPAKKFATPESGVAPRTQSLDIPVNPLLPNLPSNELMCGATQHISGLFCHSPPSDLKAGQSSELRSIASDTRDFDTE